MVRKILINFMLIIILFINSVNGFYTYENVFTLCNLNRNKVKANYTISFDKNSLTNQDVESKINFDKCVSIIGDSKNAVVSQDGKMITKIFDVNENGKMLIRDEDFNYQEIEYNVDWIDKNPPVISGASSGESYFSNVYLDFSDESEIIEIYADYYSDDFSIYTHSDTFMENEKLRVVSATRNSITMYVISNKKEMEKYNYYMDGKLYATTHNKSYTFTGLELSDMKHHFVVEALDRYGNVLETRETDRNTVPMSGMRFGTNGNVKYVAIDGLPTTTKKVTAYTWVSDHSAETMQQPYVYYERGTSVLVAVEMQQHKNYSGKYIVFFSIEYTENGIAKKFDCIGNIEMPSKYSATYYSGLPNNFRGNGNYYVRCIDAAGNETELEFMVKK